MRINQRKHLLMQSCLQVDTASTFFALPQAVYDAYRASLPGSRISSGFLLLPPSQVERLGNMTFTIGGNDFVFTPSAQLFPRDVQEKLTGTTPESLGGKPYIRRNERGNFTDLATRFPAYISVFSSFGVGSGQEYTFGMYWLERCKHTSLISNRSTDLIFL
jgi:hypothetical protein